MAGIEMTFSEFETETKKHFASIDRSMFVIDKSMERTSKLLSEANLALHKNKALVKGMSKKLGKYERERINKENYPLFIKNIWHK